jgi:ribonuclease HI
MSAMMGCNLSSGMDVTCLAFPPVDNAAVALAIVCFNWAVWTERSQYLPTLARLPSRAHVVSRICDRAKLRIPVDKQRKGSRAEKAVATLARCPPEGAHIAFTDGSSIPNPGPCGAGVAMRFQGTKDYVETAVPLGYGDNNKGEMGAIKEVGQEALRGLGDGRILAGSTLLIFSDSALCIGYLEHGWSFSTWPVLGHETRSIFRELKSKIKVVFYWIRGHAGIPGNELADAVAKRAAKQAAASLQVGALEDLRPP